MSDIDKIAPAFIAAQRAFDIAKKDAYNPHFKSHYANLVSIFDACIKALHEQGIAVMQSLEGNAASVEVTTCLIHVSGQSMTSGKLMLPATGTAQAFGSALTYARRYSLAAFVGVVADVDDDGNAASGKPLSISVAPPPLPLPPSVPVKAVHTIESFQAALVLCTDKASMVRLWNATDLSNAQLKDKVSVAFKARSAALGVNMPKLIIHDITTQGVTP